MKLPSLKSLLENNISLTEEAKGIEGLALFEIDQSFFCLYEPNQQLQQALLSRDVPPNMSSFIKGVVTIVSSEQYPTKEIYSIYAEKGYGPLLYKVAMTYCGNLGLSPTTSRNITSEAKNVWKQFFDGLGSSEVQKIKIHSIYPEEYLNYKYILKNKVNVSQALQLNRQFFKKDQYNEMKDLFMELADGLLLGKMRTIYNPDRG